MGRSTEQEQRAGKKGCARDKAAAWSLTLAAFRLLRWSQSSISSASSSRLSLRPYRSSAILSAPMVARNVLTSLLNPSFRRSYDPARSRDRGAGGQGHIREAGRAHEMADVSTLLWTGREATDWDRGRGERAPEAASADAFEDIRPLRRRSSSLMSLIFSLTCPT